MHPAIPKFPNVYCLPEARELVSISRPLHPRRSVNTRPQQQKQRQHNPVAVAQMAESTPQSHQKVAASTYTAAGLPPAPDMQGRNPRAILNTTALAFLGDSVWEVLLRTHVMGAYPALQAGSFPPLHYQGQDAALSIGANLAPSTPTTTKQSKPRSARSQRLSGRDLTVAARAKANATQQASYFDYLWAASSAHAQALADGAAVSRKPGSSQSSSSRSGTGFGGNSSSSSSKGFGVPKSKTTTSNHQSAEAKSGQGVRHSTEAEKQQGSRVSDSSFSREVSQLNQPPVDASHRQSGTDNSALDMDNPASPLSVTGGGSSSSRGSSSSGSDGSQADRSMDGINDVPRSISEEQSAPTMKQAASKGRLQAVLLTEEEMDVLRWGRNSNAVSPPKSVDSRVYKKATALEVLVGHLYLTDTARFQSGEEVDVGTEFLFNKKDCINPGSLRDQGGQVDLG